MALGFALAASRGIVQADISVREGRERLYGAGDTEDCFLLSGKTMGLIGCGNIGRALIALLRPFGGELLAYDPWIHDSVLRQMAVEPVGIEDLFRRSRVVYILAAATTENQGFLGAKHFNPYFLFPGLTLMLPGWEKVESESGEFSASGLDALRGIYIYYPINSPSVRKNAAVGLNNVPNPEALTFLDCEGEGTLELILNGANFAPVPLEDGKATISDLSFELGFNKVLVRWVPESGSSKLKMLWRNIMHQPETGFKFEA